MGKFFKCVADHRQTMEAGREGSDLGRRSRGRAGLVGKGQAFASLRPAVGPLAGVNYPSLRVSSRK